MRGGGGGEDPDLIADRISTSVNAACSHENASKTEVKRCQRCGGEMRGFREDVRACGSCRGYVESEKRQARASEDKSECQPCPFCGSAQTYISQNLASPATCQDCGAVGPRMGAGGFLKHDQMLEMWNDASQHAQSNRFLHGCKIKQY